ncbi:hypothetical protein MLD38_039481 [Melastoma candidum]|uniref:Uncharacterized protein n=1 Tax=Melastoma candidum TaxID=119954 RepID=A0ACB9L2X8_9MYRT|nr:hypothetical protein MLD38_039481 [Melastoma candidum]
MRKSALKMSSYEPAVSSSSIHRRTQQQRAGELSDHPTPSTGRVLTGSESSPKAAPILRFAAFGVIVLLGFLQFWLPATHFRHPTDPHRNWIPLDSNASSSSSASLGNRWDPGSADAIGSDYGEDGFLHIVSWMDCLDLRLLAVLANSTLMSSRYPDLLHFHFFTPGGEEDKVSFYKLKVLFPHSNLQFHSQEKVKEVVRIVMSPTEPNFAELAPFAIPTVHLSFKKFIYFSPNLIVNGKVEELISLNLRSHGAAVVEDCSETLEKYVNSDVLDAVQRSASKPWMATAPYEKDTCIPDQNIVLIDARKLQINVLEAVAWWTKVLNWNERSSRRNPAILLALYNNYFKLSPSWSAREEKMALRYDGPQTVCRPSDAKSVPDPIRGKLWKLYLPPMSLQILGS